MNGQRCTFVALLLTASPSPGAVFHSFRHSFFHQGWVDQEFSPAFTGVNESFEFVSEFESATFRSTKDVRFVQSREIRVSMTTRIDGAIPRGTETWNPFLASVTIEEPTTIRLSISASFQPGFAFGTPFARTEIGNGRYVAGEPLEHRVSVKNLTSEPFVGVSAEVHVLPPGEYDIFFTLEDLFVGPIVEDLTTTRFASAEAAITIIPAPGAAATLLCLFAASRRRR